MLFGMDWHLQLHTGVNWVDIGQIDIFTDTQCTHVGHWYYKHSGATELYWLCGILIMGGSVLSQLKPSGGSTFSAVKKTSTFFTAYNVGSDLLGLHPIYHIRQSTVNWPCYRSCCPVVWLGRHHSEDGKSIADWSSLQCLLHSDLSSPDRGEAWDRVRSSTHYGVLCMGCCLRPAYGVTCRAPIASHRYRRPCRSGYRGVPWYPCTACTPALTPVSVWVIWRG